MFTGLVERAGALRRVERRGPGVRLAIAVDADFVGQLSLGESVAVDGACLTVVSANGDAFEVDASAETMERTTLGERRVGDALHLERALRLGDRLGGHIVTGHVDATGTVRSRRPLGEAVQVWYDAPEPVLRYLVPKGSITVDGVSLTVNEVDGRGFSVVLVPHTQSIVHLHARAVSGRINLEADILGKYVERLLRSGRHDGLDFETLARAGFTSEER